MVDRVSTERGEREGQSSRLLEDIRNEEAGEGTGE